MDVCNIGFFLVKTRNELVEIIFLLPVFIVTLRNKIMIKK